VRAMTAFVLALAATSAAAQDTAPAAAPTPANRSDRYQFAAGRSTEHPVTLERTPHGVRFTWPASAAGHDTALLGVRSAGAEAPSRIEIVAGEQRLAQHLDSAALGLRWLNVSDVRAPGGTVVELRTQGITLEPGPATLRTFANGLKLDRPLLILAPHPDDAEIAAFGLYADRPHVTIVTVTSGNAGDFNYRAEVSDPARHYLLKGYLRAVDSVTVPWQGRIPPDRAYNLGYFDARLRTMRAAPDTVVPELYGPNTDLAPYRRANVGQLLPNGPRTSTWNHLVEDLVSILDKVKPEIVVVPHPLLDNHADHQFVAVALVDALEKWSGPATFLVYTNHASENLWPFGPAGSGVPLPPWWRSDVPVQGVYAHPLGEELQLRKLYALESMHDLRLSPAEQNACGDPQAPRRPDYPRTPAVDYLRRGPRPHELFFVHDREGLKGLIQTFLAQLPPVTP
jgi:LmbE family N-acetylglucosaminyl deacetylase